MRVYIDNAASTPILPTAKKAMIDAMELFGNPSSIHNEGRKAKSIIEDARNEVAKLIGAKNSEIIFTSGGTESNNMVLNTFHDKKVAVSSIEHPSVFAPDIIPVDAKGRVKIDEIPEADLISVGLANNEIGTIQDVKEVAKITHDKGALIHADATQAVGKIPVDVNELGVDYLTISAHKIGGPKGVGALFVRDGLPIKSLIAGGHQQNNLRAGTENVIGIAGFGATAKLANAKEFSAKVKPLKEKLATGITNTIPNVTINGDPQNCLPNILNVSFAGAEGESILLMLDEAGIAVSTGSACATGDIKSSHVLAAINIDPELAHNSIRFSLDTGNTAEDIDYVLEKLPPIIEKLRKMADIKEEK